MAPKGSGGKEKLIDKEDDVLQAVVLADSFNKRFTPLTTRKPRCLLPVCNAPLLDWTFESLALAGVQEIFVITRSHADQVRAAISGSKWSKPNSGIKIVPILTAKETFSPGDAMRDIYTRGLLTTDFVLVHGDTVSNIRIDEVVRAHKERRKVNKDAIMTMVVKESGSDHRTRTRGESSVFVIDSDTSECLHYEAVRGHPATETIKVPREILSQHSDIELRNDLLDCSIDVCSLEVPSLFEDNFDWSYIRSHFVHGVLTSDLLTYNIHCYIAKDGYAARVKDTRSYAAVSKDILSRWTFPLVPDDNHPGGQAYEHIRGNKYFPKDNTVTLARTSKVGNNTLIGSSTQVHENADISSSVLGRNCVIGAGSVIQHSYLFDGTRVGANCTVKDSIIGQDVTIQDNTIINKGCLLGDGVIVGPNSVLPPFSKIHKRAAVEEESEEVDSDLEDAEERSIDRNDLLGQDTNAFLWPEEEDEDSDESDEDANPDNSGNLRFLRIGDSLSDVDISDYGSESDAESVSSVTSLEEEEEDDDAEVRHEVRAGMEKAFIEYRQRVLKSDADAEARAHLERLHNVTMDLKTIRMVQNTELPLIRRCILEYLVDHIKPVEGNIQAQKEEVENVIDTWGDLLQTIGAFDAVDTIQQLQDYCLRKDRLKLFGLILQELYLIDVVQDEDLQAWRKTPAARGSNTPEGPLLENIKASWLMVAQMLQRIEQQAQAEARAEALAQSRAQQEKEEPESEEDSEDESSGDSEDDSTSGEESSEEELTRPQTEAPKTLSQGVAERVADQETNKGTKPEQSSEKSASDASNPQESLKRAPAEGTTDSQSSTDDSEEGSEDGSSGSEEDRVPGTSVGDGSDEGSEETTSEEDSE